MDEQKLYDWCIQQIRVHTAKEQAERELAKSSMASMANWHSGHALAFGAVAEKLIEYFGCKRLDG